MNLDFDHTTITNLKSEINYTSFYFADGTNKLSSYSMTKLLPRLKVELIDICRGTQVNPKYVKSCIGMVVTMETGERLWVSRRKINNVKNALMKWKYGKL